MTATSRYLDHLPMLYRDDPALAQLLRAFELVLTGGDPALPGIEETIDRLDQFVRPDAAPAELLPWLAAWHGLPLRHDWTVAQRRALIARAAWLHDRRGTAEGLEAFLELGLAFSGDVAVTVENRPGDPAGFFRVTINPGRTDVDEILHITQVARWIIDRERPAHTWYRLHVRAPAMRINNDPTPDAPGIRVGRTLLGSGDEPTP